MCVWQMRSTHCDMFSHGREYFYVGHRQEATKCQTVNGVNVMPECTVCSQVHRFCEEKQENICSNERSH